MFFKLEKKWQITLIVIFLSLITFIYAFGLLMQYYWFVEWLRWPLLDTRDFIMYSATLFSFAFLLLLVKGTRRDILTAIAFFFIVVADYFLVRHVWQTGMHFIGVTAFLMAQIFFMKRVHINLSKRLKLIDIISRAVLSVIVLSIVIPLLWNQMSVLYIVTAIYISNLFVNVIFGFITCKKNALFAVGLVLLLACDIFVGLQHRGYAWFGVWIQFNFAWLFYVPAKVFIIMSLLHKQTDREAESVFKVEV